MLRCNPPRSQTGGLSTIQRAESSRVTIMGQTLTCSMETATSLGLSPAYKKTFWIRRSITPSSHSIRYAEGTHLNGVKMASFGRTAVGLLLTGCAADKKSSRRQFGRRYEAPQAFYRLLGEVLIQIIQFAYHPRLSCRIAIPTSIKHRDCCIWH